VVKADLKAAGFANEHSITLGLDEADDGAVIEVPAKQSLVQSVDYFPALIADPYLFGQIAVNHAFSDVFAMGAKPHSALALAILPFASEKILEETLYQLLGGVVKALAGMGAQLIGGHTAHGSELALGITANGTQTSGETLTKSGAGENDGLLITKGLGTATIFAAEMQQKAKGWWVDRAVDSMLMSNQEAIEILKRHGVTSLTDITGFGLGGHLLEMVRANGKDVAIETTQISFLPGALESCQNEIRSSLFPQNLRAREYMDYDPKIADDPRFALLFDPQTSGGLMATIPVENIAACLKDFSESHTLCRHVGTVLKTYDPERPLRVRCRL
jgi:selenide, water dikinase